MNKKKALSILSASMKLMGFIILAIFALVLWNDYSKYMMVTIATAVAIGCSLITLGIALQCISSHCYKEAEHAEENAKKSDKGNPYILVNVITYLGSAVLLIYFVNYFFNW